MAVRTSNSTGALLVTTVKSLCLETKTGDFFLPFQAQQTLTQDFQHRYLNYALLEVVESLLRHDGVSESDEMQTGSTQCPLMCNIHESSCLFTINDWLTTSREHSLTSWRDSWQNCYSSLAETLAHSSLRSKLSLQCETRISGSSTSVGYCTVALCYTKFNIL